MTLYAYGNAVDAKSPGMAQVGIRHIAGIHFHGDFRMFRYMELAPDIVHHFCKLIFRKGRRCAAAKIDGIAEIILKGGASHFHFLCQSFQKRVIRFFPNGIEAAVGTAASTEGYMNIKSQVSHLSEPP